MTEQSTDTMRLLPWPGPEGKPCYLVGSDSGFVAHVADNIESTQLDMATELLDHVEDMLSDPQVTPEQLRYVIARMAESLREVHRVARSRGARLIPPALDGDG
ncbi:hypothetical protein [Streptomyces sp. TP-A0874]|uniref:hypothetical protein n=1 Tax=Streptomyces sp. TP-A0874 TaxID=549819 RepID=UPI0008536797|nr:hypothetical protein [Streptomyces sp. TP-A0874]